MRWELTEEQSMLQEALHGWLDRYAAPANVRKWSESGDTAEFDRRFAEDGWFAAGLPEEIGGGGGGLLELALVAEALGRYAAPASAWTASVLAAPLLPVDPAARVASGVEPAAVVADMSRPLDAVPTVSADASGALTGAVSTVLGGERAAWLVVPATGPDGLGLYLLAASDAGVVTRELLDRSRGAADIRFDGAAAVRLDLDAEPVLADIAQRAAVLIAADSLGAMNKALDLATEYSRTRQQFGVPIGSFQAVKHAAATILVSVEAGRSVAYYAAASVDAGHDERAIHAAVAKAQVTASAVRSVDSALVLHGAIGYTWEHDLQLYYKRAKLDEKLFGPPAVWNERVASALPLLPAAG